MSVASPLADIVASTLAQRDATRHVRKAAARLARAAVAALVAIASGGAALACALDALWNYALPLIGPVGAPLVVAGVLLAVLAGAFAFMRIASRPARASPPASVAAASLLADAMQSTREHKGISLMSALVVGAVAGMSVRARGPE